MNAADEPRPEPIAEHAMTCGSAARWRTTDCCCADLHDGRGHVCGILLSSIGRRYSKPSYNTMDSPNGSDPGQSRPRR